MSVRENVSFNRSFDSQLNRSTVLNQIEEQADEFEMCIIGSIGEPYCCVTEKERKDSILETILDVIAGENVLVSEEEVLASIIEEPIAEKPAPRFRIFVRDKKTTELAMTTLCERMQYLREENRTQLEIGYMKNLKDTSEFIGNFLDEEEDLAEEEARSLTNKKNSNKSKKNISIASGVASENVVPKEKSQRGRKKRQDTTQDSSLLPVGVFDELRAEDERNRNSDGDSATSKTTSTNTAPAKIVAPKFGRKKKEKTSNKDQKDATAGEATIDTSVVVDPDVNNQEDVIDTNEEQSSHLTLVASNGKNPVNVTELQVNSTLAVTEMPESEEQPTGFSFFPNVVTMNDTDDMFSDSSSICSASIDMFSDKEAEYSLSQFSPPRNQSTPVYPSVSHSNSNASSAPSDDAAHFEFFDNKVEPLPVERSLLATNEHEELDTPYLSQPVSSQVTKPKFSKSINKREKRSKEEPPKKVKELQEKNAAVKKSKIPRSKKKQPSPIRDSESNEKAEEPEASAVPLVGEKRRGRSSKTTAAKKTKKDTKDDVVKQGQNDNIITIDEEVGTNDMNEDGREDQAASASQDKEKVLDSKSQTVKSKSEESAKTVKVKPTFGRRK